MKWLALSVILTSILFLPGCRKDDTDRQRDGSGADQAERDRFYRQVQTKLDDLSRQIDDLKRESHHVAADQRPHYQRQIDRLEKREIDLRANLEQIKTAGKEAWADLKPRLQSALNELTQGLTNAISEFKFSSPSTAPVR